MWRSCFTETLKQKTERKEKIFLGLPVLIWKAELFALHVIQEQGYVKLLKNKPLNQGFLNHFFCVRTFPTWWEFQTSLPFLHRLLARDNTWTFSHPPLSLQILKSQNTNLVPYI